MCRVEDGHQGRLFSLFIVAMGMDKKVVDGQVRFIVAQTMGHAQLIDEFPATALDTVLDKYC